MAEETKTTAAAVRRPEDAVTLRREGTTRIEQKDRIREGSDEI